MMLKEIYDEQRATAYPINGLRQPFSDCCFSLFRAVKCIHVNLN